MKTLQPKRAFSLIELLVVILIIGLLIAILLPVLGQVRRAANLAATQATMRDISSACNAFTTDHKRAPGYFSVAQMGLDVNGQTRGFSAMKNILLDLSGGVTKATTGNIITVGPGTGANDQVNVDLDQLGSSTTSGKAYFTPDKKNYAVQVGSLYGSDPSVNQMPELLDAFGQPILAWVADERPTNTFALKRSDNGVARFYWGSNYAALWSDKLGKMGRSQKWTNGTDDCSMIGWGAADADIVGNATTSGTLEALLGNPAFPTSGVTPVRPAAARGSVIVHSAGPDGVFMAKTDRGSKTHRTGNSIPYKGTIDPMKDFDDLVQSSNN